MSPPSSTTTDRWSVYEKLHSELTSIRTELSQLRDLSLALRAKIPPDGTSIYERLGTLDNNLAALALRVVALERPTTTSQPSLAPAAQQVPAQQTQTTQQSDARLTDAKIRLYIAIAIGIPTALALLLRFV